MAVLVLANQKIHLLDSWSGMNTFCNASAIFDIQEIRPCQAGIVGNIIRLVFIVMVFLPTVVSLNVLFKVRAASS